MRLADELFALADEDAAAYAACAFALKLPREAFADKEFRDRQIRETAQVAAEVPLRSVERCHDVLLLAEALAGRSNVNASSDLRVAALLAEAAGRGAAENVLVNLPLIGTTEWTQAAEARVAVLLEDLAVTASERPRHRGERGASRAAGGAPRALEVSGAAAAPVDTARRLEGAPFASEIRDRVAADVADYVAAHGYPPGLAVVVCGRSAPSMVYLERILKACAQVGIEGSMVDVPGDDAATQAAGADRGDPPAERRSARRRDHRADAAAGRRRPPNRGRRHRAAQGHRRHPPAQRRAPAPRLRGLRPRDGARGARDDPSLGGRGCAVRTRSSSAARRSSECPLAFMLTKENATVTVCHSKTRDLAGQVRAEPTSSSWPPAIPAS